MESITSYKASDGKLFESEEECVAYEMSWEVRAWYAALPINERLWSTGNVNLSAESFAAWVIKNSEELLGLLGEKG